MEFIYQIFIQILCIERSSNRIQPALDKASIGESVSFTCSSDSVPRWYFEQIHSNPMSLPINVNKVHHIAEVAEHHNGYYYCYGTQNEEYFVTKATLIVYGMSLLLLIPFIINEFSSCA